MPLRDEIQRLANAFTSNVLRAIRESSLEDIVGAGTATHTRPVGRPRGRPRKNATSPPPETPATTQPSTPRAKGGRRPSKLPLLIGAVHGATEGLSAGQLMDVLGVSRSGLGFLLERAMATGDVRRMGQGKGTKYVAG